MFYFGLLDSFVALLIFYSLLYIASECVPTTLEKVQGAREYSTQQRQWLAILAGTLHLSYLNTCHFAHSSFILQRTSMAGHVPMPLPMPGLPPTHGPPTAPPFTSSTYSSTPYMPPPPGIMPLAPSNTNITPYPSHTPNNNYAYSSSPYPSSPYPSSGYSHPSYPYPSSGAPPPPPGYNSNSHNNSSNIFGKVSSFVAPAAAAGAAYFGAKKLKKSKLKKAMKYGLPIAGAGVGAYALSKAFHHSSSSSSSSDSD